MESEEIKKIAVNLFEGFDESNMAGSWIEFLDITNILFQSVHSMIWMSTLHQLEYFCDMPFFVTSQIINFYRIILHC